jgi:GAF domain-containing protein
VWPAVRTRQAITVTVRRAPLAEAAVIAATVAGGLELPGGAELLTALADATRAAFGAVACSVATLDETAGELVYRAAAGEGAGQVVGSRLPLGAGLAGFAAVSGQTLAVDDVSRDPRFAADVAARTGYTPRSLLVTPIRRDDQVLGVLSVLDRSGPPGPAALDLAVRCAAAVAGVLELDRTLGDMGRLVFEAAARAVGSEHPDVASALRHVADSARADDDLAVVVAAVAEARRFTPAERMVLERMLEGLATLSRSRRGRR